MYDKVSSLERSEMLAYLLIIFLIARNSHVETKSKNTVQDRVVSGFAEQ